MWQWLDLVCGGFLALSVLFLAVALIRLRRRFNQSPAKQWRDRVLGLVDKIQFQGDAELETLRRQGITDFAAEDELYDRAFHSYLESVPVSELEAFPGIGPATIAKLREAGYADLSTLHGVRPALPGLGKKRLTDVMSAARKLAREYQSRFDAGACPQALTLYEQLTRVWAGHSAESFRSHMRLKALGKLVHEIEPAAEMAHRLTAGTFVRWRLDRGGELPAMRQPLPDLDLVLRQADEQAEATWQTVRQRLADGKPAEAPIPSGNCKPPGDTASVDLFARALDAKPSAQSERSAEAVRLELTVQFAYSIARADGRVARKEKELIEEHFDKRLANDNVQRNRARALCAQYEHAVLDPEPCLRQIAQAFATEERATLLTFGCAIADATGDRNPREAMLLEKAAGVFGVALPSAPLPPLLDLTPSPPAPLPLSTGGEGGELAVPPQSPGMNREQQLATLEIDSTAPLSPELIRRQYHLLSERFAAAKLENMGKEFVAMAEGKRAAILVAANALLAELGQKLEAETAAPPQELRHNPDLDAMFGV
jgi:hypothetical protein